MAASGRGAIKRQQLRATKRRKLERARDAQRSVVKREWHGPLSQRGTPVTSSSRANWPECSVRQLSIRLIINYIDAFELIPSPSPSVRPRGAAAPQARAFRDSASTRPTLCSIATPFSREGGPREHPSGQMRPQVSPMPLISRDSGTTNRPSPCYSRIEPSSFKLYYAITRGLSWKIIFSSSRGIYVHTLN